MKLLLTSAGIKNTSIHDALVPGYAIDDQTAIKVTDGTVEVVFSRGTGGCLPRVRRPGGREMSSKVIVNRAMSLDGFIAGPGDAQDWIFDFMANDASSG